MSSSATYTRKRRIGAVAGVHGTSNFASVDVKSEFAEFRHVGVVKKSESTPRRGRKVEEREGALVMPKEADVRKVEAHPSENFDGRDLKAEFGGDEVAGEVHTFSNSKFYILIGLMDLPYLSRFVKYF